MSTLRRLTAVIERESDGYVALCPEFDIASQGDTVEEARANLTEALTLFYEDADVSEVEGRYQPGRIAQETLRLADQIEKGETRCGAARLRDLLSRTFRRALWAAR